MASLWAVVVRILGLFLGTISFQPAPWMLWLLKKLGGSFVLRALLRYQAWARENPARARKQALIGILSLVLAGAISYSSWRYYQSRPKPQYVDVMIDAPREPNIEPKEQRKLEVRFSESVAPLEQVSKTVEAGIQMTPEMAGSWLWVDDHTLIFTPAGESHPKGVWRVDQKYELEFGKKLFAGHVKFKTYQYSFMTPSISGRVASEEFYQDPTDAKIKRAIFRVHYNYEIDIEDFKKRAHVSLRSAEASVLGKEGKGFPFAVGTGKFNNEIFITTEPVAIPATDMVMDLKIEKGVRTARGGDSKSELTGSVDVPGLMTYFRFESAKMDFVRNERYEPEQILVFETKAEVASEAIGQGLEVQLLPAQNPDEPEKKKRKKIRNYHWASAAQVTPKVRAELTPVKFKVVPTEHDASTVHSFRLDVPAGRYLYVKVPKGLKSFGGYELAQDFTEVVSIAEFPKELSIMSKGSILSYSGERKIPVLSRNIATVNFKLARFLPEQLNNLVANLFRGSGEFSHPDFDYGFSIDSLAERFDEKRDLKNIDPRETNYFHFDLDSYLQKAPGRKGVFYLEVASKGGAQHDHRLVMVTDLGLILKENAYGASEVFVQNVRTGAGVANAEIEVIGVNGLGVFSARTSADGKVTLPDLENFKREKRPIAVLARSGADFSFIPYRMNDRLLNVDRFDVGGVYESKDTEQLVAYVFSDRGIYRPGEAAQLGLIVRSQNPKNKFQDVPLFWSVTDPRGVEILRTRVKVKSSDMLDLKFSTDESAPTGVYEIRVFLTKPNDSEQQIGATTVRVEEFLPDRLKISATISGQKPAGWIGPKDLKGLVTLRNLFGTPAEGRKVEGEMTLNATQPYFSLYKDYQFMSFRHKDTTYSETLVQSESNVKGEAEFALDLGKFGASMYWLRFNAEGFDSGGGRSVRAAAQALVSTLPYLVGYKTDSDLAYLKSNANAAVELIAINSDLKKIEVKDVAAVLLEKTYVSALMKDSGGVYRYQSVVKEIERKAFSISISEKGTAWSVPTDKAGDYTLVLKAPSGEEVQRISFGVVGEGNLARSLDRTSELQVILNKHDLAPNETVEMQIKAPYPGSGLITIERDRVYAHKWFHAATATSVQQIQIPAGLEGNAYISVTMLRDSKSREIFMSPLAYAVQPFSISLDSRMVNLKLQVPERVRPGDKLQVRYSANKAAEVILYGVDEGILQVAGYKLPDPLEFFFRRRALQVKTYQLLDLLMPDYSLLKNEAAPGGDGMGALGKNLNPFKRKGDPPVVFWSQVLTTGPQEKVFTYNVPDSFNGGLRVMAVAASETSFGSTKADVVVRGEHILSPNAPMFVAGGDEVEVSVGVSNQEAGSGEKAQIKIKAEASDRLQVVGTADQTVAVAEGHEGLVKFRFKAKPSFGDASIKFKTEGVKAKAQITSHMSVRPAVPYQSFTQAGFAESSQFEVAVERKLIPEFATQETGVSSWPLVLGRGFRIYLDNYPYGCTEQLISKAVPYLTLGSYPEFKVSATEAQKFFAETIRTLRSRQVSGGGFSLYSAGSADSWATLHAVHYLVEAKAKGLAVPAELLESALNSLPTRSGFRFQDAGDVLRMAESLYLLAREGVLRAPELKYLREYVTEKMPGFYAQSLGGAYVAATLKIYNMDSDADAVLTQYLGGKDKRQSYGFYDAMAEFGASLVLISRHFPERIRVITEAERMKQALKPLQRGLFNTYSSANLLYGFDALASAEKAAQPGNAGKSISEVWADKQSVVLNLSQGLASTAPFSDKATQLSFSLPDSINYFYFVTQSGFDSQIPTQAMSQNLEVSHEMLSGPDLKPVSKIALGDEVTIRVRARSTTSDRLPNIAIVDLLPGGFEPILESIEAEQRGDARSQEGQESPSEDGESIDSEGGAEGEGANNWSPLRAPTHREHAWIRNLQSALMSRAWAQTAAKGMSPLRPASVDRREDRMVLYATVTKEGGEFTYRAKAVARGTFVVPPAFAQSMYDSQVVARGVSGMVTVE